jgi:hypothetical protein
MAPTMSCEEEIMDDDIAVAMLRQHAEIYRLMERGPTFHGWLLEHGELCGQRVRRKGLTLMTKKHCFSNSMRTIMRHEVDWKEWFYTEGVVASPDLPILIDHAWLTNREGEVLDRTLRSKGHSYFGIPFKPDFAIQETCKQGYYGLFSNGVMYNRDIVGKKRLPGRAWRRP